MGTNLSRDEIRSRLQRSEGPAGLAVDVHAVLRGRTDGVAETVDGLTAVGGSFAVRHPRSAVRVLLLWLGPPQGLWALSISPQHKYRKRRREQDLALTAELRPLLDQILDEHVDVSDVVWMTEEEAETYPL
jgi:cytochrome c-type biogenesis protein CcmH/NrfF